MTKLTDEEVATVDAIKQFGETVTGLRKRQFRFVIVVSVAFGIVLLLILGIIGYILFSVVPRLDENTKKVKENTCSLYKLALTNGYHPENRVDPDKSVEEQKQNLAIYNEQYKTIVNDNNRLECTIHFEEPDKYITDPAQATTTTTTTTLPT